MITSDTQVEAHWLTGKGPGALSVLRVSGENAWSRLRLGFRSVTNAVLPLDPVAGSAWLGTFPDSRGRGDQVLLLWRNPSGQGFAEIQSHHGLLADKVLAKQLGLLGISVADSNRGSIDHETFASSRTLFEREKLLALSRCPNRIWIERVFAWSQRDWPEAIASIRAKIGAKEWAHASDMLEKAIALAPLAMRMEIPFEILISGPPNAGKSSLLNRLVGFDRAIVSPQAGTTRDLVTGQISLGGWLVNLTDSAGRRDTEDPLEAQGIEKAIGHQARVDAVIWVSEASHSFNREESLARPKDAEGNLSGQAILVQNKSDLLPADPDRTVQNSHPDQLLLSARSGAGLDQLLEAIRQKLGLCEFPRGLPIPFTQGLTGCLHALLDLIKKEKASEALQLLSDWGVSILSKDIE